MLQLDTKVMTHTQIHASTPNTHTHSENLKVISKSDYPEDSWQSIVEIKR